MYPRGVVALLLGVAALGTGHTAKDGGSSVFDLGSLVAEADGLSKGMSRPSATQSALKRVEAMKEALTAKMLNSEIQKLPYSEKELGEGMAVTAMKDKISDSYAQFKDMAKSIESQKDIAEKKLMDAELAKTKAEETEMKARKDAAELREKLRTANNKLKNLPENAVEVVDKLRNDVTALKDKIEDQKRAEEDTKRKAKHKLEKMQKYFDVNLQKNKQELVEQRAEDEHHIQLFQQDVQSRWYVNTSKLTTLTKQKQHLENAVQDLESQIRADDIKHNETLAGMKAEFQAEERDLVARWEKRLSKSRKKAEGEKQEEAWDKEEQKAAEKKAGEDNAAMAAAVKENQGLNAVEEQTKAKLSALAKKEDQEVQEAEAKENSLELKAELEKVNEDMAEAKVNASKADAELKSKEATDSAGKAVKEARKAAQRKVEDLRRKMERLQEQYAREEEIRQAREQEKRTEERVKADEELEKAEEKKKEVQVQEQEANAKAGDATEQMNTLKEELERERAQLKEQEIAQEKEEERFKTQIKEDQGRIRKRAGARTTAEAEKQEVEATETKLAMKDAELEKAVARADELAKHKDALQKKHDDMKVKLEHAEYRLSLEKKKSATNAIELQKRQLELNMVKQSAKHDRELGESKSGHDEQMENKYKYQVKATQALKEQVGMARQKAALNYAKNQKWEAKAQKYKQAMYEAENHARRIASRVRKKWVMKMINEQDAHTKELLKLKSVIALRAAKNDAEILKVKNQRDAAQRQEAKAEGKATNGEQITNYVAGLVAEQAMRGKVLRNYMFNLEKIRGKYQKNLKNEEYEEIKKLKHELDQYKNGREIAGYKYKIMKLQNQLKEADHQKEIHMEVKRSQELDIQTLMAAAIKRASRGSEQRSAEENRKRVDAAVEAVIRTVKAADDEKGSKLARDAIKEVDGESKPVDGNPIKMRETIARLQKENQMLRTKMKGNPKGDVDAFKDEEDEEGPPEVPVSVPGIPKPSGQTNTQKKLLTKLNNLIKLSYLPKKNNKVETDVREVHHEDPATQEEKSGASNEEGKREEDSEAPRVYDATQLGELRKDALLVPAESELQDQQMRLELQLSH